MENTEKEISLEVNDDDLDKVKELVKNPLYKGNIEKIMVNEENEGCHEEYDENIFEIEVKDLDSYKTIEK